MTVIELATRQREWRKNELDSMLEALEPAFEHRAASGWEVASTEHGDPQFYLLGPRPDQDCILCISRVGQTYVVNDGIGRHIVDLSDLTLLSVHVQALLRQGAARVLAKLVVLWCGARQVLHEKIEPIMTESEEFFVHLASLA